MDPERPLVLKQPWDGYLSGPENALAQAGVLAMARGEGISPLVLHGPAGVGKTRLLEGLVAERLVRRPESAIAHLTAEAFAIACAEAAGRSDGWAEVRARFRGVDLFVLDDLHFLERLPWTMIELGHTLDALDDAGADVAIATKLPPGQWQAWPTRLISRFVGGLSVRVEPPGLPQRRRYVLDRSQARKITLTADAVDLLAESADGYRTLDGWLARLVLAGRVEKRGFDRSLVESLVFDDPIDVKPSIEMIARAVSTRFGVPLKELRAATRRQTIVEPRHLAMHLARELTGQSFAVIGTYFGGRDKKTVIHACEAAAARQAADPALAAAAEAIAGSLRKGQREPEG